MTLKRLMWKMKRRTRGLQASLSSTYTLLRPLGTSRSHSNKIAILDEIDKHFLCSFKLHAPSWQKTKEMDVNVSATTNISTTQNEKMEDLRQDPWDCLSGHWMISHILKFLNSVLISLISIYKFWTDTGFCMANERSSRIETAHAFSEETWNAETSGSWLKEHFY